MSPFKVFGVLSIAFGCVTLAAVLANMLSRAKASGGHDISSLWILAVLSWVLGGGLYCHHKWAAVAFATMLSLSGLCVAITSVGSVPMPWLIGNIVLGAIMLAPAIITIRSWHLLRGKHRM